MFKSFLEALSEEMLDQAQTEQRKLIVQSLDDGAKFIESTLTMFVQKVLHKQDMDSVTTVQGIPLYVQHLHSEVKLLKTHRCFSSLKDAANAAAKLIRMAEKVRNRAMRVSKKKGKSVENHVDVEQGSLPFGIRSLFALKKLFDEDDDKKAGFEDGFTATADKFFPGKGRDEAFGKVVKLDGEAFDDVGCSVFQKACELGPSKLRRAAGDASRKQHHDPLSPQGHQTED